MNRWFGFSVRIPSGLEGHTPPLLAMDYGIGVVVSSIPKVYIYFLAEEYVASKSLEDYQSEAVERIRKYRNATSVRELDTRMSSLQGKRIIATYACKGQKEMFVQDQVMSVSESRGVHYHAGLLTTPDRYENDRKLFEQFMASWKLIPKLPWPK